MLGVNFSLDQWGAVILIALTTVWLLREAFRVR